ncbi:hypothetical protein [Peribacillus muralis]|uniref:hypothetical protein n=1 Tax=Peribacillus muralis TaxID=264697 RepID=UPI00214722C5
MRKYWNSRISSSSMPSVGTISIQRNIVGTHQDHPSACMEVTIALPKNCAEYTMVTS